MPPSYEIVRVRCVEFFVDMFPDLKLGYGNFEANAAAAFLMAFGIPIFAKP
ncbi:MAG: hypothetical protein ABSG19_14560 [Candidatus Aminicenantales bacterium]